MKARLVQWRKWAKANAWFKRLLIPALYVGPGPLLTYTNWNSDVKTTFSERPWLLWTVLLWSFVAVCFRAFGEWLDDAEQPALSEKELMDLFKCVDEVVAVKLERFSDACEALQNGGPDPGAVFNRITRPDLQMETIMAQLWTCFDRMDRQQDAKLQVSLARMGSEHIEYFVCFQPKGSRPRSSIASLQSQNTGFSQAKSKRSIVIIPSKLRESRSGSKKRSFQVTSKERTHEDGSLICYPVFCRRTDDIPYVIAISTTKSEYFTPKERGKYEVILSTFSRRIMLEHYLLMLKEASNGQQQS